MPEMVGDYTPGYNVGGTRRYEVLRLRDPQAQRHTDRYEVALEVDHQWQAQTIAVVLNAGKCQ